MSEMLSELTDISSVEERFQARKRLYENRDILADICRENSDVDKYVIADRIDELENIQASIIKGKDILLEELRKHKALTLQKIAIDEFESSSRSSCFECEQKLGKIRNMFAGQTIDNDILNDVKDAIDGALYSISCLYNLIQKTVDAKSGNICEEMNKNNAIIRYMAKAYHVIQHTNIGHTCPICLTKEVDTFCEPCGHNFCKDCLQCTSRCFMCRSPIQRRHSLYFS